MRPVPGYKPRRPAITIEYSRRQWCEMAASLGVNQLEQRVSCERVAGQ
jgi:hypothetical protein